MVFFVESVALSVFGFGGASAVAHVVWHFLIYLVAHFLVLHFWWCNCFFVKHSCFYDGCFHFGVALFDAFVRICF